MASCENVCRRSQLGDVEVAVRWDPCAVLRHGQSVACWAADELDGDAALALLDWCCEGGDEESREEDGGSVHLVGRLVGGLVM